MIPTREQIKNWTGTLPYGWLCAMRDEIDRLRADLDRANTEAALARDALAKERAEVAHHSDRGHELTKKGIGYLGELDAMQKRAEKAEAALAKASDPAREEEIKAWRDWALGDIADPDLYDDCFVLSRAEIDAAVALMRRADGKALLRELRAWIIEERWVARGIIAKINEMLAKPAPAEPCKECEGTKTVDRVDWPGEHANRYQEPCPQCTPKPAPAEQPTAVFSGARTIAESAEPPTPYMAPAPVPDDPRWGLVAQLADVVASIWGRSDCIEGEAKAIAAKLRGGA